MPRSVLRGGLTEIDKYMDVIRVSIPTTDGEILQGQVLRDPTFTGKRPVILVLHGWTSRMARYPERVKPLVDMGYIAVLFDMRGHGETGNDPSKYSRKDHLDDCLAAFDFIKQVPNTDKNDISVFGSSYGGYLACLLTSKRPVRRLVLKAPAQYPDGTFEEIKSIGRPKGVEQYRLEHHTKADNVALKAMSQYRGNLLLMECEKDEEVPKQVMDDYRSVITTEYDDVLLRGADHACKLPGTNQMMIDAMTRWFQKRHG